MMGVVAHVWHWGTGSWTLLGFFLGLLAVGITLAVLAARGRSSRSARDLLGERLARGDLAPEEYRERLDALGPPPRRALTKIATAFTAAGLLGAVVVGATAGPGFMHRMMGGMGSMMGSGDTGRSGPAPVAGAREVRVSAREFSFAPAEVRVRGGETVNVLFDNRGNMFHTLTIGGLGLDLRANGGDEIAGSFKAGRAGSYPFVCAVSGHAEAGMRGTVTVSE